LPEPSRPASAAATGTADDGSMSSLRSSSTTRIAATISGSETVTTSSTCERSSAKLRTPMKPRNPSAIVFGLRTSRRSPLRKD
jgi:hypothetical protein